MLWTGDVRDVSDARNLLCIVDQVHKDAQSRHYQFVVKHLTVWLSRYKDICKLRDQPTLLVLGSPGQMVDHEVRHLQNYEDGNASVSAQSSLDPKDYGAHE
jgi:hypothetical protein